MMFNEFIEKLDKDPPLEEIISDLIDMLDEGYIPSALDIEIITMHDLAILEELLKYQDQDNNLISLDLNCVLYRCARDGDLEPFKLLLEDSRVTFNDKMGALKVAIRKYQEEIVKELIKDPRVKNAYEQELKESLEHAERCQSRWNMLLTE